MAAGNPWSRVRWPQPDFDTFLTITWLTAVFFFLVAVVSGIGEVLGWWDLVGEIGMSVGATLSVLATLVGIGAAAGREQVDELGDEVSSVGRDVQSVGRDVRSVGEGLRSVGSEVQSVGSEVQSVGSHVQDVHSAVEKSGAILVSVDSKLDDLDDLDKVQLQLDKQTGVLEDIRDLL